MVDNLFKIYFGTSIYYLQNGQKRNVKPLEASHLRKLKRLGNFVESDAIFYHQQIGLKPAKGMTKL